MSNGEVAVERRKAVLVEDGRDHPEVLVQEQLRPIADGQSGRFLPAMLQCEEPEGRDVSRFGPASVGHCDAEYAAHASGPPTRRLRSPN